MCTPPRRLLRGTLKLASSAGAIVAVIALAGTALTQEITFRKIRTVPIPGSPLVSFDISWFDSDLNRYYLGDRSNKSVDVIDPPNTVTQFKPGFIGFTGSNDTSGPDGVLTLFNTHTQLKQ